MSTSTVSMDSTTEPVLDRGLVPTTSTNAITSSANTASSSTTVSDEPRVEVSIVGSPEVFGGQEAVAVTKSSASPDSHEERHIERCDIAASPSDPRPPKKRYTGSDGGSAEIPPAESPSGAQLPRAAPPPSAFCDARQVPTGEQFLQLLYNWQWVEIDNTQLPSVMRGGERFLAVHMVQLKLLSKFPPAIPAEIISRFTMVSHKMSTVEAWQFNAINAIKRKFDLGCQLFTTQDEVVRLNDVQLFYWNVKALNLSRIIQQYDAELQNTNGNLTLIATIQSLKNHVEADLERVRKELRALAEQHQTATQQPPVTPQAPSVSNNMITIDDHHHHVSNGAMITSSLTETQQKDINVYS
ncbi:hypothetical protein Y032_0501g2594 [Ancylostoma ceylanicum]|uniref:Uncharacterized protein n=2 Tax=Ancylostoma ceylanicum TaxID=53326 RepID=A0A016WU20_9BILA|nr:hypothetical protein Y032_0501g2594 [Ancylostoma ceylanicum]